MRIARRGRDNPGLVRYCSGHGGVQGIQPGNAGGGKNMTLDGLHHILAGKPVVDRAALQVDRVKDEVIVVHQFVIPGRAGTVVAEVIATHIGITGEPVGIVIQALAGALAAYARGAAMRDERLPRLATA